MQVSRSRDSDFSSFDLRSVCRMRLVTSSPTVLAAVIFGRRLAALKDNLKNKNPARFTERGSRIKKRISVWFPLRDAKCASQKSLISFDDSKPVQQGKNQSPARKFARNSSKPSNHPAQKEAHGWK